MRNPNRIPVILNRLGELWGQVPDWRLGQLFCNLQRASDRDLFFLEDDELLRKLEWFLNEAC